MKAKILFVDDDTNILAGYARQLYKQFAVDTAEGGEKGLEMVSSNGPYAVVVADMRMPGMHGVDFLRQVKTLSPHTVRMMLTGNVDQQTAIDAVNEGHVFRFLNKPCTQETMIRALEAALEQYQLVKAEAELLEKTLVGSIGILTDLLAVSDPVGFGQSQRVRRLSRELAEHLAYSGKWQVELAALLSPVALMTLPNEFVLRIRAGQALTEAEKEQVTHLPEVAHKLLSKIPRLGPVAQIIYYSQKNYDGTGFPEDMVAGEEIPLGARILRIVHDMLEIEDKETPRLLALRLMRNRTGWYDTNLLDAAQALFFPPLPTVQTRPRAAGERLTARVARGGESGDMGANQDGPGSKASKQSTWIPVRFDKLKVGDVLASDVLAEDGSLLLKAGNQVTNAGLEKLNYYANTKGICEPIRVLVT